MRQLKWTPLSPALPGHPAPGARRRRRKSSALANDHSVSMDRPENGRWQSSKAPGVHQVPFGGMDKPEHLQLLAVDGLYQPGELFDQRGRLKPDPALAPVRPAAHGVANLHANGGAFVGWRCVCRTSRLRRGRSRNAGAVAEATRVMGVFLRDVMRLNPTDNFRVFGPDETASNLVGALFAVTDRSWMDELCRRRAPGADGRFAVGTRLPGLARGLPADGGTASSRATRPSSTCRLDVQPARQVEMAQMQRKPWRPPIAR